MTRRANSHRSHGQRRASRREWQREQLLRSWFGSERADAEFSVMREEAVSLGDVVGEVMKDIGMRENSLISRLRRDWVTIVGPDISRVTCPQEIWRKRLQVGVDNPTWMFVLNSQRKDQVEQAVKAATDGEITQIQFVASGSFAPPRETRNYVGRRGSKSNRT